MENRRNFEDQQLNRNNNEENVERSEMGAGRDTGLNREGDTQRSEVGHSNEEGDLYNPRTGERRMSEEQLDDKLDDMDTGGGLPGVGGLATP